MDRRTALKNLGLGIGATVAGPTLVNLLASCNEPRTTWKPLFFSETQGDVITKVVDVIFPVSDLPGAVEVNVPQLIDLMFQDVESTENQDRYKKGLAVFQSKVEETFGKKITECSTEDVEVVFESFMKVDEEQAQKIKSLRYANPSDLGSEDKNLHEMYNFLLGTRDYTIFGYYSSEKVGKEVLNYDAVPGEYIPCMPMEEIENGHAWSLS